MNNNLSDLVPMTVNYTGIRTVGQYIIESWNIERQLVDGKTLEGIVVSMKLILNKFRKVNFSSCINV